MRKKLVIPEDATAGEQKTLEDTYWDGAWQEERAAKCCDQSANDFREDAWRFVDQLW